MIEVNELENIIRFNNEIVKQNITKKIQVLSKKIIDYNQLLRDITLSENVINSHKNILKQDNQMEKLYFENTYTLLQLRSKIYKDREKYILKLNEVLRKIVTIESLREIFKIKGRIKENEIKLLLNDIQNSLTIMYFEDDEKISNFIFVQCTTKHLEILSQVNDIRIVVHIKSYR